MLKIEVLSRPGQRGVLLRGHDDNGFCWQLSFECLDNALIFIRGFFHAVRMLDEHDDTSLPTD